MLLSIFSVFLQPPDGVASCFSSRLMDLGATP
jgi:hypothetical protein